MVLQIRADARHIGDHPDAVRLQQRRGTDAGELQKLRRVERAAGEDHLAAAARRGGAAPPVFDADGAAALEQDRLASAWSRS